MGDIGAPELLIILLVLLLLFGGSKLPELARSLGKAKNEFHKAQADSEVDKPAASTPTSLSTPVPESATPAAAIPEVAAPEVAAPETVTMTTSELERLVEERARQLAADPDHPAG
jgi:TatA/E family protein of Tat protein translocase